jgi:membrane protein insertase Oxa1/YidC/SpoIIIJ
MEKHMEQKDEMGLYREHTVNPMMPQTAPILKPFATNGPVK